jgi:hypothetical protein
MEITHPSINVPLLVAYVAYFFREFETHVTLWLSSWGMYIEVGCFLGRTNSLRGEALGISKEGIEPYNGMGALGFLHGGLYLTRG